MSWPPRKIPVLSLALTLAAVIFGPGAAAQEDGVSGGRPAEYMIYQYPGVDLVIVVDVQEAEFDTQVLGPDRAQLKEAFVPGRRVGPVFQYIDAADLPRQLMIKVNPARRIDRSRISMELMQLAGGDRNAAALSRAYKLLAQGMERSYSDDTSTWASKI